MSDRTMTDRYPDLPFFGLPTKVRTALYSADICKQAQLAALSRWELLRLPWIGNKAVQQINEYLGRDPDAANMTKLDWDVITIQVIDHKNQRYDTAGDWQERDRILAIRVSRIGDWRMEACLAVHELIEVLLCRRQGISQETVDSFDIMHPEFADPGNLPDAPYRHEHCFATGIERLLAAALGVEWAEYEKRLDAL